MVLHTFQALIYKYSVAKLLNPLYSSLPMTPKIFQKRTYQAK